MTSEQTHKALRHTQFVDPRIPDGAKQNKLDNLCELTTKINQNGYEVPAPDYDIDTLQEELGSSEYSNNNLDDVEPFDPDHPTGSLSPDHIKKMLPKELKDLNKDIKIMQKRGFDPPKRPEFMSKHHEIRTKGLRSQEEKERNESELIMKLKSRSEQLHQQEEALKQEEEKPEFLKVQLRKKSAPSPSS